jgi:hypothetical protein
MPLFKGRTGGKNKRKAAPSLDPVDADSYCMLAYFNVTPSQLDALQKAGDLCYWIKSPSPRLIVRNPDRPDWSIWISRSGKAVCCSFASFDDAKASVIWLRTELFPKAGIRLRTEAIGEIIDGVANLRLRTLEAIRRVSWAENFETVEAIASLGDNSPNLSDVTDIITDQGLTDIVSVHLVDGHNRQLRGLAVDVHRKEALLLKLAACAITELESRSERAADLRLKVVAVYLLRGVAVAGWGIILGVLGNAVYQYVVQPLIAILSETHAEEVTSSRTLDHKVMLSSFPILEFVSVGSPIDVLALSQISGLRTWEIMLQLNLLRAKGVVGGSVASGYRLMQEPDVEVLSFGESGFHPTRERPMPVRLHDHILSGLTVINR